MTYLGYELLRSFRNWRFLFFSLAVEFRPRFIGLAIVWAVRRLQDEHVTFTFEEHGRTTEVRVTGKLRRRAHTEVTRAFDGA